MKEVEVTGVIDAPRAAVKRTLSPRALVEYAETYTVQSTQKSGEKTVVTVRGKEIETVFEFIEHEDGYVYTQRRDEGPFEEMRTHLTVTGNGKTRVSVRSEFTFGGWTAFLTDWLAADIRREELERLLVNLTESAENEG